MTGPHSRRPSAREERLDHQAIPTGLLSVQEAAALASAGFTPVSEVIGAVANTVTPTGFYSAGFPQWGPGGVVGPMAYGPQTYTSSSGNLRVGVPSRITALKAGYRTALSRLSAEARAVRADGVVGVRLSLTVGYQGGAQLWRFLAIGTAVRSGGATHTETPFTTDLSGSQVAAALHGGWVPVALVIAPCMAIRWVDWTSRSQRGTFAANVEVEAYTDLINTCRHQARQDFAVAARAGHAEAAVLTDMSVEFEIDQQEPVCTALVTITGTSLAGFARPGPRIAPLAILPLRQGRTDV
ncbi:MAG: hypothetical protein JWO63_1421 [Frankiales bacterium]|jgi:uncharacterized protein YbjQ (UPF0145 family)|nr:hypothetical protein [Frankiales bacterium]